MNITAGFVTDVGLVRSINEDTYVIDEHLKLFGVADGVGGHRGGEVASTTAIETLRACIANGETIAQAIDAANTSVFERSMRDSELTGMGTTITVARAMSATELQLGHVGDSRAYLLRGEVFNQITNDHSMVGDLVRQGQITQEQAALHPRRNVITRAVGMEPTVSIDVIQLTVQPGDRVLICSDGITDMLHDEAIALALMDLTVAPQVCAESLANQALANGGIDNLTAVVFDIDAGDQSQSSDPGAPIVMNVVTFNPAASGSVTPRRTRAKTKSEIFDQQRDESYPRPANQGLAAPATWRSRARWIAITVLPLILVLVASYGALKYNNSRYWYVGDAQGRVALFQGSPDAPLGWEPQRKATSAMRSANITDEVTRRQVLDNTFCASSNKSSVRECFERFTADAVSSPTTSSTTSVPKPTSTSTAPSAPTVRSTTTVAGG